MLFQLNDSGVASLGRLSVTNVLRNPNSETTPFAAGDTIVESTPTCGHLRNLLPNILPKGAKWLDLSRYQQLAQLHLKPLRLALHLCLSLCQLLPL